MSKIQENNTINNPEETQTPTASIRNGYFRLPNEIFRLDLSLSEFKVLCFLIRCNGKLGFCFPSLKTIASACKITEKTVTKALVTLRLKDVIFIDHSVITTDNGGLKFSSNRYFINDEIIFLDDDRKERF